MIRKTAANLVVLLVGTLVALLIAEVVLRVYNPFYTRIKGDRIVLPGRTRLHFKSTHPVEGIDPELTITLNSLGFRGAEPPPRFAEHLTLIAIGGSTTRCGLQSDDKTWVACLGRSLEGSFRDVWINNAGLDGHTTRGHLVLLEDHIVKLRPRLCLFLVGVNEIVVGPDQERVAESVRTAGRPTTLKGIIRSVSAYSEVVALALSLYRGAVAHWGGLGYNQVGIANLMDYESTPEEERADLETTGGPERLAAYAGRLERIIAETRDAGIEPVFLTQPLLAGRGVDDRTGRDLSRIRVGPHRNGRMLSDLIERYNEVTRIACRRNDVLLVDLAREVPRSSRYFFDFMHFNNDGNVLVADIVRRHLCPHLSARYPEFARTPCPLSAP